MMVQLTMNYYDKIKFAFHCLVRLRGMLWNFSMKDSDMTV